MHGSAHDFLANISAFLGSYYLAVAAMNAVAAFYLWHYKHDSKQGMVWILAAVALVIFSSASLGGSPPGVPAGLKLMVNEATGPVVYSVGTTLILVVLFVFREFFVQPPVAFALLNLTFLIMGMSMADPNFASIVTKADNVPIVGLDLSARFLHLAGHVSGGGKRSADAQGCRTWRNLGRKKCWFGPTWCTPS